MTSYLRKRGKKFHFRKRVPKDFQGLFPKAVIQVPLNTDSEVLALHRASNFNLILEDFWKNLIVSKPDELMRKFQETVLKAKISGFRYLSKDELVKHSPLPEFVNRIHGASVVSDVNIKSALLGSHVRASSLTLSKAKEDFFAHEEGNHRGKSEHQIRKWKNPREKAVNNFIRVIGNKSLDQITRQDVLDFRAWWVKRIHEEGLTPNSANKDFTHLGAIIRTAVDNNQNLNLPYGELFRNIALQNKEKNKRYPFTNNFIQETLFSEDIIQLNREAHLLIFAMADTGARINELVGLEPQDVFLSEDIPYISIRPNDTRDLKTPQSERDIPLVGASLYAFQELNGTFDQYLGKPDLISNTINKYLRGNNILPSDNHSLYSLRHSFEDRLTAVEPPDKLQAALMGHKYTRPRYGLGPSLEQKRVWLEKIAFKV